MTLKKINILEYAFGEGGGGHPKAYAVYAFINVDNCERPLKWDLHFGSLCFAGYDFCECVLFERTKFEPSLLIW